jgi:hexosaminidase
LPRVSPYTSYFHTGGDEVNQQAYLFDDTVNSNESSVLQPLMQKFVDFNHDQVRKAGLTPIVWEEMLLVWNVTLGSDVVVQTWQSDQAVIDTVNKGHKALAGNYNYWVRNFTFVALRTVYLRSNSTLTAAMASG